LALVNQPPILASSFAVNGDKNTIPTTNSGTEGLASLSLGFPPITQQPVSQGGIPPQRADFNGIFNLITNFLMFIQNGSIFAYSSTLDYQPPAIVYGNNALYRCIATNGANTSAGVQSLSNTNYWQPLIPVGGITVSGNTITVTNEIGTQIQYTIDIITNPPSQSDSSNKIVTSAWVKAYAPSKTGVGASGTWNININGNASTATKATQDANGLQIDTNYLKNTAPEILASNRGGAYTGGVLTLNKGNSDYSGVIDIYNNSCRFWSSKGSSYGFWLDLNSGIIDFKQNPTTPTPSTNDNSTKIATTAFVQSLLTNKFTASKLTNGWWKDGNTGMIWQWCTPTVLPGNNKFPLTFPNKCLYVFATNTNRQGPQVDNAFGYPIDNSTYYFGTKRSDEDNISTFPGAILAIGY
jgi:hypothetical protein